MPSILGGGASSVLGGSSTLSLLQAGKRFSAPGIGLSSQSRAQLDGFLSKSQAGINNILSGGLTVEQSNDALKKQILAMRASLPQRDLAEHLRDDANADNGKSSASKTRGANVDTSA